MRELAAKGGTRRCLSGHTTLGSLKVWGHMGCCLSGHTTLGAKATGVGGLHGVNPTALLVDK